jgi:serine/threonine-protein kinase
MSPEQARRPKTVDARTDIWSFGVILYEFLTGTTPWPGDHPLEVLSASVSEPMPSLLELRPDVPRELEAVIAKCLAKKPEDRHQTIADLAQALAPFAPATSMPSISRISGILRTGPGQDGTSTTLKSFPIDNASADTEAMPSGSKASAHTPLKDTQAGWGKSQATVRRSRFRIVLGVGAGALLVALVVYWLAPDRPKSAASEGADAAALAQPAPVPNNQETERVEPAVVVAPRTEASSTVAITPASATPPPTLSSVPGSKPQAPLPSRPRPTATAKPVVPIQPEDPLDGRR